MAKVTINVTTSGWETIIEFNGKTFVEKHKRTPLGAKCVTESFEDQEGIPDELIEATTSFAQYDIMMALNKEC